MMPITEEKRWEAVLNRNRDFDGVFVYAVRSTGIYCRPSCSSRRPRRRQVLFFPLPEVAEQEGYRACRRCHPKEVAVSDPEVVLVQRICRYINENPDTRLTLSDISGGTRVSAFHLQRTFKRVLGISPRQYMDARRVNTLKQQLKAGRSVTESLYEAGYGSSSRLYERASEHLGMTPAVYRRDGRDMEIRFTTAESPLGKVLVATTQQGICAVSLGESEMELERTLRQEYSGARIHRDDQAVRAPLATILKHLTRPGKDLDLPIDVIATAFQRRVWEELRRIPFGMTRSYAEIANAIGRPEASRAVAQACASNHVAIVIPCHRVVRKDGSAGGYRWGLSRKRQLLEAENKTRR